MWNDSNIIRNDLISRWKHVTKYEKQIYDIVNASRKHLTADQVYCELQSVYPAVSRATVYNNLRKLCEIGIIRRVSLEDSPDRYDRIQKHDHLICQRCGKISDICFEDLTQLLKEQFGEDFLFYDLKVFCICSDCRKEHSSEPTLSSEH